MRRTDRQLNDGPLHVSVGGHLEKIRQWGVRIVGTDPMTVRPGYDVPSSGSRFVIQGQNWGFLSSPMTQMELLVF